MVGKVDVGIEQTSFFYRHTHLNIAILTIINELNNSHFIVCYCNNVYRLGIKTCFDYSYYYTQMHVKLVITVKNFTWDFDRKSFHKTADSHLKLYCSESRRSTLNAKRYNNIY